MFSAQLMRNTGCIFANDVNKERCRAIVGNAHRLGISNCVISNMDGKKLSTVSESQHLTPTEIATPSVENEWNNNLVLMVQIT